MSILKERNLSLKHSACMCILYIHCDNYILMTVEELFKEFRQDLKKVKKENKQKCYKEKMSKLTKLLLRYFLEGKL